MSGASRSAPPPLAGGGSGTVGQPQVFVQDTQPSASYPYIWVVTDAAGNPTGEIKSQTGGAVGPVDVDAIQAIANAKGDLLAATADNLLARLAAGADNTVLTADSTAPAGLAYKPSGKVSQQYKTGRFYTTPGIDFLAAAAVILNRFYFFPFRVDADSVSFDQIGINTGAAAGAGGIARLAVYAPGADADTAGAMLASAQVATDTAAGDKPATIALTLTRGFYWLAAAFQVSVTGLTVGRGVYKSGPPIALTSMSVSSGYAWKSGDTTSGALPDPGGAFVAGNTPNGPAVFLRAA